MCVSVQRQLAAADISVLRIVAFVRLLAHQTGGGGRPIEFWCHCGISDRSYLLCLASLACRSSWGLFSWCLWASETKEWQKKNSKSLGGHQWGLIQVNTPFTGGCRDQMFSRPKDFFTVFSALLNIFVSIQRKCYIIKDIWSCKIRVSLYLLTPFILHESSATLWIIWFIIFTFNGSNKFWPKFP